MKLVIALVIIVNGVEDDTKKTFFKNPQHCEWIAQEITRERKYFRGVEDAYCRVEWVDKDTPVTNVNVIPFVIDEENQE